MSTSIRNYGIYDTEGDDWLVGGDRWRKEPYYPFTRQQASAEKERLREYFYCDETGKEMFEIRKYR